MQQTAGGIAHQPERGRVERTVAALRGRKFERRATRVFEVGERERVGAGHREVEDGQRVAEPASGSELGGEGGPVAGDAQAEAVIAADAEGPQSGLRHVERGLGRDRKIVDIVSGVQPREGQIVREGARGA